MQVLDGQLGFDALLASAAQDNETRQQEKLFGHLPGTIEEAVPYMLALIDRHHAAMLSGDGGHVESLREEAHHVALKLNGFEPGILAGDDAPGNVLERLTAAKPGSVPLWGQSGSFEIAVAGMRVLIQMDGLFGIGACYMSWLSFSAHALDWDRPFLSETGFRSFCGVGGALSPGYTPDRFAAELIEAHVKRDLKGKLASVKPEYRP
jgi:hypothetical protein